MVSGYGFRLSPGRLQLYGVWANLPLGSQCVPAYSLFFEFAVEACVRVPLSFALETHNNPSKRIIQGVFFLP